MSAPARIVDKLRNYEYEKCGYDGAVGDIYALIHHIAFLEEEIEGLRVEVREKNAWEGRYNALLEEWEASRPREIDGGKDSQDIPKGAMVVSRHGNAWGRERDGWMELYAYEPEEPTPELPEKYGPYTLVYTPKEEA